MKRQTGRPPAVGARMQLGRSMYEKSSADKRSTVSSNPSLSTQTHVVSYTAWRCCFLCACVFVTRQGTMMMMMMICITHDAPPSVSLLPFGSVFCALRARTVVYVLYDYEDCTSRATLLTFNVRRVGPPSHVLGGR